MRILLVTGIVLAFLVLPASAGIASSSGAGSITSPIGGDSGAFGPAPDMLQVKGLFSGGPWGLMSITWNNTPAAFLANDTTIGPTPSGDPFAFAPSGFAGAVDFLGTFTVTYTMDAFGLAPVDVPGLAYGIFWAGPSAANEFHASISWDSAGSGHLGTQKLDFTPPFGSIDPFGAFPFPVVGDPGFTTPALAAGDTLTLSGSFELKTTNFGGPSSEIKVYAQENVPEPATAALLLIGLLALPMLRRRTRG